MTTPAFNRHTFPRIPPGSHRRTGMYLHLQEVDRRHKNARALKGRTIRPDHEVDLPVGAIIVQKRPTGTGQFGKWAWRYAIVPPQDAEWQWSPECDDTRFITFRDNLTAALQFAPTDKANGYRPDPELAAPANFPRPPGPETALAMARFAFTTWPDGDDGPPERWETAKRPPPPWLVAMLYGTMTELDAALAIALAYVCEPTTPQPAITLEANSATAYWEMTGSKLRLTADGDGGYRAEEDNTDGATPLTPRQLRHRLAAL